MSETRYPMETYVALLNLLIASEFILSCNDELKHTTAYRHSLKQKLRMLEPELEKIIDNDFALIWGVDDEALYNLQHNFRNFIQQFHIDKFKTHSPELIAGFGALLEQFHQMPELVLHRNGIKIVQSSK